MQRYHGRRTGQGRSLHETAGGAPTARVPARRTVAVERAVAAVALLLGSALVPATAHAASGFGLVPTSGAPTGCVFSTLDAAIQASGPGDLVLTESATWVLSVPVVATGVDVRIGHAARGSSCAVPSGADLPLRASGTFPVGTPLFDVDLSSVVFDHVRLELEDATPGIEASASTIVFEQGALLGVGTTGSHTAVALAAEASDVHLDGTLVDDTGVGVSFTSNSGHHLHLEKAQLGTMDKGNRVAVSVFGGHLTVAGSNVVHNHCGISVLHMGGADGAVDMSSTLFEANAGGGACSALEVVSLSPVTPASVQLDNVTFVSNQTGGSGGGAMVSLQGDGADVDIEHTDFAGNFAAGSGGALALLLDTASHDVRLTDVTFTENTSLQDGGAVVVVRDGFTHGEHSARLLVLDDVLFDDNQAIGFGGGMHVESPSTPDPTAHTTTHLRSDVVFRDNVAGFDGGGLSVFSDHVRLGDLDGTCVGASCVKFADNEARRGGGASLQDSAGGELQRTRFVRNRVTDVDAGSGLHLDRSFAFAESSLFVWNEADEPGETAAIGVANHSSFAGRGLTISHNTGWGLVGVATSTVHLTDSLLTQNLLGTFIDGSSTLTGGCSLHQAPAPAIFDPISGGPGYAAPLAGNFHIPCASAAPGVVDQCPAWTPFVSILPFPGMPPNLARDHDDVDRELVPVDRGAYECTP